MKKIVAVVGSNSKKSNTEYYIKRILEKIENDSNNEIKGEIIILRDVKIDFCLGCTNCFNNGFCPLDIKDNTKAIKEKLFEADMVIMGSPVYAHNITGIMKNFFDRISYWTHLLRLGGKYGYAISTTSSNGDIYAVDYINHFMTILGLKVIGKSNIFVDSPVELYDEKILKEKLEEISDNIIECLLGEDDYETNQILELLFDSNKKKYDTEYIVSKLDPNLFEWYYWQRTGLLKEPTFNDAIKNKRIVKEIKYLNKKLI